MKVKVGEVAPPFMVVDTDKHHITNETLKGHKALLLFIPAAFTGTCKKEFCMMRDDIARYSNMDATVIGISTDTIFTLKRWKEEEHYNFPLASDYNKTVGEAFGIQYEAFMGWMHGVHKRSAFVLDAEGIVRYAEILEHAGELPNFEAINKVLEQL